MIPLIQDIKPFSGFRRIWDGAQPHGLWQDAPCMNSAPNGGLTAIVTLDYDCLAYSKAYALEHTFSS